MRDASEASGDAVVARLERALEFYADLEAWGPGGWIEGEHDDGYPGDLGATARVALGQYAWPAGPADDPGSSSSDRWSEDS